MDTIYFWIELFISKVFFVEDISVFSLIVYIGIRRRYFALEGENLS